MCSTYQLELFPDHKVTQLLFRDVKNAAELRQKAMVGRISGTLLNATMVVNPFQVLVAANKAINLQQNWKMKTRSLFSEIIFNLSPTNNISEAFKRFGISEGDDSVLVVLVHKDENAMQLVSDITAMVDGRLVPVEDLSSFTDLETIKKLYKITPQEDRTGTLLDAVICRMAAKDVM